MTSYQNVQESQIKGYNDCPVLDYSKKNSSSTSLKSRRRLVSQTNASSSSLNSSAPPTTTMNGSTPIPKPPSTTSLRGPPSLPSSSSSKAKELNITDSISNEDLLQKLQSVLNLENSLPEREFQHYQKRLVDQFTKGLGNEAHKVIVLKSLENYENKEQVKNALIQFMLSNGGVSTWCLPLRKVLENIVI